jgi:hypothetical protein
MEKKPEPRRDGNERLASLSFTSFVIQLFSHNESKDSFGFVVNLMRMKVGDCSSCNTVDDILPANLEILD